MRSESNLSSLNRGRYEDFILRQVFYLEARSLLLKPLQRFVKLLQPSVTPLLQRRRKNQCEKFGSRTANNGDCGKRSFRSRVNVVACCSLRKLVRVFIH